MQKDVESTDKTQRVFGSKILCDHLQFAVGYCGQKRGEKRERYYASYLKVASGQIGST